MAKPSQSGSSKRSKNSVRIIGGFHRTRKIHFPDAPGLRPTADRIRETLFNWLRDDIHGARCLDLFAGSGALGIESLSRGAKVVEFVEMNSQVKNALAESIASLEIPNAVIHLEDALSWIHRNKASAEPFDVVFLDPPFADGLLPRVCQQLADSGLLKANAKIYLESDAALPEFVAPDNWQSLKSKRAGNVRFELFGVTESPQA